MCNVLLGFLGGSIGSLVIIVLQFGAKRWVVREINRRHGDVLVEMGWTRTRKGDFPVPPPGRSAEKNLADLIQAKKTTGIDV
jgi:hypothetical protein